MTAVCRLCRSGALSRVAASDRLIVLRCSRCRAGQAILACDERGTHDDFDRLYTEAIRHDKADECWQLTRSTLDEVAGRRILDVGCGRGAFLDRAAAAGMVTTGLEPDVEAQRTVATRHRVIAAAIDDPSTSLTAGSFDVVTMWDVLEHVSDPRAALQVAIDALVPGGRLIVATPAMGTVFDRLAVATSRLSAGREGRMVAMCWSEEHLTRFDPEGLRREVVALGCSHAEVRPLLLLSLRSDRYAMGGLLPAWTQSSRLNRLISRAGVAVARGARLHNKVLLDAVK